MRQNPSFVLDETREELSILTHVGRPDEQLLGLGSHELLNPRVLEALVDPFEDRLPEPRRMSSATDSDYAHRISAGTVGLRLTPTKVVANSELSQNETRRAARG